MPQHCRWKSPRPQPMTDEDHRPEMEQGQSNRPAASVLCFQSLETYRAAMIGPAPAAKPIGPEGQQPREKHARARATNTRPIEAG